jgi:hypothetical protein
VQLLRYTFVFDFESTLERRNKKQPDFMAIRDNNMSWDDKILFNPIVNFKSFIMKTFRISLIVALSLFVSAQSFATNIDGNSKNIRKEIAKMIDAPDLSTYDLSETYVLINFTINDDNEIVVQHITADNEEIRSFVFNNLNNRKVNVDGLQTDTSYNLKVSFRKEA